MTQSTLSAAPAPSATAGAAFERLVEIIARLRAPDGCPWDREQTHETLRAHLLEETHETLDAIERADDIDLCEELGDLLMQPVMHAQLASEEGRFDITQVLDGISDKLLRRHPHVFGDVQAETSTQVLANWDAIKKQEKAGKAHQRNQQTASILDDAPDTLPSLLLALKVSKKAAKVGFEWSDIEGVVAKIREECDELESALKETPDNRERIGEELGDLFFTAVNLARWQKIDPELALRDMVRRFKARFAVMEIEAKQRDLKLEELSPEQWEELWSEAKTRDEG